MLRIGDFFGGLIIGVAVAVGIYRILIVFLNGLCTRKDDHHKEQDNEQ